MKQISILLAVLMLCGCAAISKDEPFGEREMSTEQAAEVLEQLTDSMGDMPERYYISFGEGISQSKEYFCGGYRIAYSEGEDGDYLWLDGKLFFCDVDNRLFFCEMGEDELADFRAAESIWQKAAEITASAKGKAELEFIPMAKEHPYHLEVDFPEGEDGKYAISAYMRADGGFDSVSLKYSGLGEPTERFCLAASFYFDETANDIQAERRIWRFGNRCGVIAEPVPALKEQKNKREYCESIISAADFLRAAEQKADMESPFSAEKPLR